MTCRSAVLALSLLCLASLPLNAAAQTMDGPFFSKQHLVSYWQSAQGSSAIEIALNAYVVYTGFGFGPAFRAEYYVCGDGLIRTNCNQIQGPFTTSGQLSDYLNQSPGAGFLSVYLDGAGFMSGFGPNFGTYYYQTCYGDVSPYGYGTHRYIVMQSGFNIYGPVPSLSCLPQL